MSKSLALLSGKGGSGKTTIALSIASMLASCGVKVLLIDCDLVTNGATYFYESKLKDNNGQTISFYKILSEDSVENCQVLNINQYMDFIPSVIQITEENTESYVYHENDKSKILGFNNAFCEHYDIVIYDCQAGYTDIFKLLLPLVDVNLVVMEADAISSSSIRSLHLKVGNILNGKKVYQIFNKASKEEYDIYSKVSGGTVFTNVETVRFDWKIRKAFSLAQIPNMESTSANYGEQVYNICKVLFKEEKIQEKLEKYKVIIQLNQAKEEEDKLEAEINELSKNINMKNKNIKIVLLIILLFISVILMFITFFVLEKEIYRSYEELILIFVSVLTAGILFSSLALSLTIDFSKEKRTQYETLKLYRERLEKIISDSQNLQEQYDNLNKKLKDV